MSIFCSTNGTTISLIHLSITTLLILTSFYASGKLFLNMNLETIYYLDKILLIVFLICTNIGMLSHIFIAISFTCYQMSDLLAVMTDLVYILFYCIQSYVLLMIFFRKVKTVFAKTPLRLSRLTANVYKTLFIALPVYMALLLPMHLLIPLHIWSLFLLFGGFSLIVFMISLLVLFVYKLVQAMKYNAADDQQDFVYAITKTTILSSISTVITFVDIIAITTSYNNLSDRDVIYYKWFANTIGLFDLYTNFACVVLLSKVFQAYYVKLCSCLHAKCSVCIKNLVHHDELSMVSTVISNSSAVNEAI
eukprot:484860_1